MAKANYVRVIIDRAIHRELDYAVPESLTGRIGVGSRVRVPFREKSALATVVALPEQTEAKGIRPIEAIIGDAPVLSEELLELARWIGTYAAQEFGDVVRAVIDATDRVAGRLSPAERAAMTRHFVATSRYEWMFWEMGHRREAWPV